MSVTSKFSKSSVAAIGLLNGLLSSVQTLSGRSNIPSLLEILTTCHETGVGFPELELYARSRGQQPALLLCGGNAQLAAKVAAQVGYALVLPEIVRDPIFYSVESASQPALGLRTSANRQTISRDTLMSLIDSPTRLEEPVFIEESVVSESNWRFIWVPRPFELERFLDSVIGQEILIRQQAALVISDETPEILHQTLRATGQKWWELAMSDLEVSGREESLLAELRSLNQDSAEELEIRRTALWHWLSARVLEKIEAMKKDDSMQLDRIEQKIKLSLNTLQQYQVNWIGGLRNLMDAYLTSKQSGASFAAFYDAQKPGPQSSSFVTAIGPALLKGKLETFHTDRMVEFVAGLGALAVRLELRQIALGEINTRWILENLSSKLEKELEGRRVFPEGGGKRSGIMGALTGKTSVVADERKGQISKACRTASQLMENDFAEWCRTFMSDVEKQIRLQLTAALANRGLPDPDQLRTRASGLSKVARMIQGEQDQTDRDPETVTIEWLKLMTNRRWFPAFVRT